MNILPYEHSWNVLNMFFNIHNSSLFSEKSSFFSKLFGRNKKKEAVAAKKEAVAAKKESVAAKKETVATEPLKKPSVEYATFSAQFPPPEWIWYQQQLDRQLRTESWVQQQVAKAGTWHYLNKLSSGSPSSSIHMGACSVPERVSMQVGKPTQHFETKFGIGASRKISKKSHHKHKDRQPVVIANSPNESTRIEVDQKHTYRNSLGQTNIKLSSLPTRMSPSGEVLHSNYVTHPMLSSTPKVNPGHESHRAIVHQSAQAQVTGESKEKSSKTDKSKAARRLHKSKKKSHHDRHSSYHPNGRHVSGMSTQIELPHTMENDISFEYQGQLPNKNSAVGQSHSSGVNCVGLEVGQGQRQAKGQHRQRSSSYRHTVIVSNEVSHQVSQRTHSYRQVVTARDIPPVAENSNHGSNHGHIYANVHATEQDAKPKLPERTHRQHRHHGVVSKGGDSQLSPTPPQYSLDLPESDRRSEHGSDRGTLTSTSSQGQSSLDSAIEGTESSEHSTVINTRPFMNRQLEQIVTDTQQMSLGDSGFSSPRVAETSDMNRGTGKGGPNKDQSVFLCNNLKKEIQLNNSTGKLDEFSDDSFDRISSDRLYENVKFSQKEVLNNMKYLHKEINVSSQNLNVPNVTQENSGSVLEFDPKQAVAKKFNFEGDFHVVGVV